MTLLDVECVVDIHLSSFIGFFLSSMGASFLKVFYQGVLFDKGCIAFVIERDQRISGFVVGTSQPAGFYKRVLARDWLRLLLACVVPVLKQPLTSWRLVRRLLKAQQTQYHPDEAFLMSIAVSPFSQGLGIGQQLVAAFLEEAKNVGISSVGLTTDKLDNERVNQFYLQAGFTCTRSFCTPEGRQMNEYLIDLPVQQAP